jgi:tetratricopeptide (TPR) repeat protein
MRAVEGPEILRVFKKYMGIDDIPALEKEWHEYIKGLELKTSRGYEEAGFAALRTGRKIKANRFFKLAVEKGSKNPQLYERYADMLRKDDKIDEAIPLLKKGIELEPLSASLRVALAKALRVSDNEEDKKEAERLLKLAKELDPDNVDLGLLIEEAMEKAGKKD